MSFSVNPNAMTTNLRKARNWDLRTLYRREIESSKSIENTLFLFCPPSSYPYYNKYLLGPRRLELITFLLSNCISCLYVQRGMRMRIKKRSRERVCVCVFRSGVNFTNILHKAFLYESFTLSFLYLHLRFVHFWRKKLHLKCW